MKKIIFAATVGLQSLGVIITNISDEQVTGINANNFSIKTWLPIGRGIDIGKDTEFLVIKERPDRVGLFRYKIPSGTKEIQLLAGGEVRFKR